MNQQRWLKLKCSQALSFDSYFWATFLYTWGKKVLRYTQCCDGSLSFVVVLSAPGVCVWLMVVLVFVRWKIVWVVLQFLSTYRRRRIILVHVAFQVEVRSRSRLWTRRYSRYVTFKPRATDVVPIMANRLRNYFYIFLLLSIRFFSNKTVIHFFFFLSFKVSFSFCSQL